MKDKYKMGSCDLNLKLRICGHNPKISASTDEGDGFSFHFYGLNDEDNGIITEEIKSGWVAQLKHIIDRIEKI